MWRPDGPARVAYEIVVEERNTLLNRYRHSHRLATTATLLQDDDVLHSPAALRAFAWMLLAAPKQILGVSPERDYDHRPDADAKYRYAYVYHPRGGPYSFLLGQTSVLDAKYLSDFLALAPRTSLTYIMSHKPTCEDLTLHFYVANRTRLPPAVFLDLEPIIVAGPRSAQMHTSTSKRAWSNRRERCLGRLVKEFGGRMPLVRSTCRLRGNFSVSRDELLSRAYAVDNAPLADDFAPAPRRRRRRSERKTSSTPAQNDDDDEVATATVVRDNAPVESRNEQPPLLLAPPHAHELPSSTTATSLPRAVPSDMRRRPKTPPNPSQTSKWNDDTPLAEDDKPWPIDFVQVTPGLREHIRRKYGPIQ